MELFARAKAVRLKSHHDKFLYADEDEVHVTQDRNGAASNARWSVEPVPGNPRAIRLRSRYGRYLTASAEPFLLGMTGRKVTQTAASAGRPDPSVEWEPVRDGFQARLKTRSGHFLRANGELPPWRNSVTVTHDVPHRTATQDWVLWDVEIVQVLTTGPERADSAPVKMPDWPPPLPEISGPAPAPHHRPSESYAGPHAMRRLSKLESSDFFFGPLHELEGRAIHYHIADHLGNVDDGIEGHSFTFYGSNLEELTHKLQEETGLDDIMVCTRSPINGKLTPLHLQLPPNNAAMHIVLVQESSKDSAPLKMPDSPPPPEISYPPLPPHHRPSRSYDVQRKMARAAFMRHRRWAWVPEGLRKDWGLSKVEGKTVDSLSLGSVETEIAVTDWIDTAMAYPVTASLGPMAPLLRQINSLTHAAQGGSAYDVESLKKHLEVLCRDLLDSEETSSTPKWWRKEVRELLYDTEDLLDEVILCGASDISELVAGVEEACERRKCLHLPAPNKTTKLTLTSPQRASLELPMPISAWGDSAGCRCIVGVEETIKKLVDQLAFDDHNQKQLKVVPILGFPGVGKTTAAGTLYHRYRGKFQCSAFVRVSRTPDMRSLLICILSQIKAPQLLCGLRDVHDLSDAIKKHLKGKRYLIIMDGLWTASVWDVISRVFPDGDYSSRIITTTQIYDVALACCRYYPDYILEMSPLNDDQSRRLLFTRIFGFEDPCPSDFEEVSNKIANKCAGLPLAIVTVASLLARKSNLTVKKWEHIQNSLPSILRTHTHDSLPSTFEGLKQVLSFVYNNLPPHLHTCLLYLSMNPEGYLVSKHDLVRQWVAEGFVIAVEGRSAEEVAASYFDELVSSGMVQPVYTKYGSEVSCTVHHMVLDLIRQKSKEMNFVITVDYLQSWLALPDEVRRLSLQFGGAKTADIPENILISKVRSLLFSGFFECLPSLVDYLLLRVLILHVWADGDQTSFYLTEISKLHRLRYLKIQCNMTVNLPDEISGLKHLETLEVDARLSGVPSDIVHLKKLLHLLLPSEAILPQGIGGLTSLLTLGCFDLSKNSIENVFDLAKLTKLHDLRLTWSTIPFEHLPSNMERLRRILENRNDLRFLTSHGAAASRQSIGDDGLSRLSYVSPLLEKLELLPRICTLSRLPEWIGELSRLSILKIEVWDLSDYDFAILKRLKSLTALSLTVLTEHAEWIDLDEGFPVLKYFKFVCTAPYITFFQGAMPNVQKLKLAFNADRIKPDYKPDMYGFKHMSSLTEVSVKFGGANADESIKENAERVFKEAFINHQNSLIFNIQWVDSIF